MLDLLRSELFRLSRRWMPRVLLLILAAVVVVFYLLLWTVLLADEGGTDAADLRDALRLAAVRDVGLTVVAQLGSVLLVILAASTIATEYSWGTIRTLLPRATSRTAPIVAKLIALLAFATVLAGLGFAVAVGASALVTTLEDLPGGVGPDFWPETIAALGRTVFTMLPYGALAFLVALWGRSSAAGISVGLVVLLLEGLVTTLLSALGDVLDWLPAVLLSENASAVLAASNTGTTEGFAPGDDLPDPWRAAAVLAAYTAAFVALAIWRFRGRDVTSG